MIGATALLRQIARRRKRRLDNQNAIAEQERVLLRMVRKARNTKFGRDHDFANIKSVADFQARVPLRRFEDMWDDYWGVDFPILRDVSWPGLINYFATTSGTTSGASKFIPVTNEMIRTNTLAGLDLLCHHVNNCPDSQVLGGKAMMLGGTTVLDELAKGVWSADLSGISQKRWPAWFARFAFPPVDIALMDDWEKKVHIVAELIQKTDVRVVSGTPSWVLVLFDVQQKLLGHRAKADELYPHMEMLVHGGVNFDPYRSQFEEFLDGKAELREVYPSSEGFIAVQDESPAEGLRLIVDRGLFFEFVPFDELDDENPPRLTLADVQEGVNYALVLSNCSGAWAYIIGDTVRFVTVDPPRVRITGRTSYFLSAFGEHMIAEEIEIASAKAANELGVHITDYSVGAVYPDDNRPVGGHLYVMELVEDATPEFAEAFSTLVDNQLRDGNKDYRAHRSEGFGMAAPDIRVVPPGTFAGWMKSRGRLGGQNKVPRIINDQDLFQNLRDFADNAIS
ncbi:MAG: GH3 auxin-responsive promoter family protein [Alphaproteobacteria bacterium]|nr:MAG: GH3 auxin-responsive promoter family protein [Alphaproteobacteria bacterium]